MAQGQDPRRRRTSDQRSLQRSSLIPFATAALSHQLALTMVRSRRGGGLCLIFGDSVEKEFQILLSFWHLVACVFMKDECKRKQKG